MKKILLTLLLASTLITPAPAQDSAPKKITLLHFWATWCGPCVVELPQLDKLAADYAGKGLAVITFSEDSDGAAAVDKFMAEHPKITHLKVIDDPDRSAGKKLGIGAIPVSILIGPDGKEIRRFTGGMEWDSPSTRHELDLLLQNK